MKVRELIAKLEIVPPDADVCIRGENGIALGINQLSYEHGTRTACVESYCLGCSDGYSGRSIFAGGLQDGAKTKSERRLDIIERMMNLVDWGAHGAAALGLLGEADAEFRIEKECVK